MLQIIIDGKQAVLPVDIEISLNYFNPCFGERKEDATYPLTLNLKANRHIFGYPERTNNIKIDYTAIVMYGAYKLLIGQVFISSINDNYIELFIATDNTSFWGKYKNILISDLDLGTEKMGNGSVEDFTNYGYPNSVQKSLNPFVLTPLWDESATGDGYDVKWLNHWDFDEQKFKRPWNSYFYPFPRLCVVMEGISKGLGYNVVRNDLSKDFKDVIIVNRRAVHMGYSTLSIKDIVPVVSVEYFFNEIYKRFNISLFVNEKSKEISFIDSNISGYYSKTISCYDGFSTTFKEKTEVNNIKYCDKDISSEEKYLISKKNEYLFDNKSKDTKDISSEMIPVAEYRPGGFTHDVKLESSPGSHNIQKQELYIVPIYMRVSQAHTPSEIRLAVYRGFADCQKTPNKFRNHNGRTGKWGTLPVSSSLPIPESENKISLAWKDLYNRFHKELSDFEGKQIFDFNVKHDVLELKNQLSILFSKVVIRNKEYITTEQTIVLGIDSLKEHSIKCYPL